jgi:hypothetical protein
LFRTHVYRPPPTSRPQYYRPRTYEPYTLRWLYSRATEQFFIASIPGTLSTESLFYGQSPAIATGDICVIPLVTPEDGFVITASADGVLSIAGDGVTTDRQTIPFRVYRLSTAAFESATAYLNNQAPIFTGLGTVYTLERNQSVTPQNTTGLWTEPESDALTYSSATALPGTLAISADGTLAGISPDANSITLLTERATDIAGDFGEGDITVIVGNVTVPNVRGQAQDAATTILNGGYLNVALGTAVFSDLAEGLVVSQTPAADNEVAPYSTITIVLSLGTTGVVTVLGQVGDLAYVESSGVHEIDLSSYFSAASTFSIAEALPSSITLAGATLSISTTTVGSFGPFTVTGASATDSASLNAFEVVITAAPIVTDVLSNRPRMTLRQFLINQ